MGSIPIHDGNSNGKNGYHGNRLWCSRDTKKIAVAMAMSEFSLFWCRCHCCHKWVQYPFMMATAMETIVMAMEKMGIMESGHGVQTVCEWQWQQHLKELSFPLPSPRQCE